MSVMMTIGGDLTVLVSMVVLVVDDDCCWLLPVLLSM